MFLTIMLLVGLIATPVASPVVVETDPDWITPLGVGASVEPFLVDDLVIVAGQNSTLYALDTETGETVWNAAVTASVSAPMVGNGDTLLVPTEDGALIVISVETGETLDTIILSTNLIREPLVVGNEIIVADKQGTLWIVDADTYETRVSIVIPGGVEQMVAVDSIVVIASSDSTVHAMDIETTGFVWETVTSGPVNLMERMNAGDIFIALKTGDFLALSSEDGSTLWQQIPVTSQLLDVTFAEDSIIGISSDGDVIAVNPADGNPMWQNVVPSGGWFASEQCDATCFLVQTDGTVSQVMPAGGFIAMGELVTQEINVPPAATESSLVIVTAYGDVHLWQLSQE